MYLPLQTTRGVRNYQRMQYQYYIGDLAEIQRMICPSLSLLCSKCTFEKAYLS